MLPPKGSAYMRVLQFLSLYHILSDLIIEKKIELSFYLLLL